MIFVALIALCFPVVSTYAFIPERTVQVTKTYLDQHRPFHNALEICSPQGSLQCQCKERSSPLPLLRLSTLQDIDLAPLYLSSIAGASTCIGAAIVFMFPVDEDSSTRSISPEVLGFSLALAGSVMLTVSAVSIIPECFGNIHTVQDVAERMVCFAGGTGMYYLLSKFALPDPDDIIREQWGTSEALDSNGISALALTNEQRKSWRLAVLLFLSLLLHNIPEGFAVSASAIQNDELGYAVAIAIAMHNIPEGLAISVPCLAARPDLPWLAFAMASASGLAEPIAALVPLLLVSSDQGGYVGAPSMDNVLAFAAGIMILVSLSELLPEARRQVNENDTPGGATDSNDVYYFGGLAAGFVLMFGTEAILASALL